MENIKRYLEVRTYQDIKSSKEDVFDQLNNLDESYWNTIDPPNLTVSPGLWSIRVNATLFPCKSQETLAKSHWLKPLRDCQNLLWISLLPIQIRFCLGAGKTSLSFSFIDYIYNRINQ